MQRLLTSIFGFLLLLIYWSVHDSIDSKLFGPSGAANIAHPDQAVYAIDLYPGAQVKENNLEHEEAYDDHPALWQYTWILEVPQSASVVADFYQRRMGAPHEDEEFDAPVYEKKESKPGEVTRVIVAPDPENAERSALYVEQLVSSNASSLGWKTRRTIIHVLILGGIAGLCTLGLFIFRKKAEPAPVTTPIVTPLPHHPSPIPQPQAPEPVNEEATFFQELEAHFPADWRTRRDRFELTVQRPGKAPLSLDIEPLFYLWKRPGVDRGQAISQFLEGRVR